MHAKNPQTKNLRVYIYGECPLDLEIPPIEMHICIDTDIHTRLHACMPACLHACIPTCLHAYTYMPIFLHAYTPTRLHSYMPTCLHAYTPTCLHAYTPTRHATHEYARSGAVSSHAPAARCPHHVMSYVCRVLSSTVVHVMCRKTLYALLFICWSVLCIRL